MNYLGIVAYLGAAYRGFERQKGYPTIQGTLETALSRLAGHPLFLHGAGRTDAGVSARGQAFSFKTPEPIADLAYFRHALNRLLPSDIVVRSLSAVPDAFDARHSSSGKVYSYALHFGERDPFAIAEYQLEVPHFDFALFENAMGLCRGRHDFRDFTPKPTDKDGFVRTIRRLDFALRDGHLKTTLEADGFMTYMVRIMVGVALRAGEGKMALSEVSALLDPAERKIISFKADPRGLVLEEVLYG